MLTDYHQDARGSVVKATLENGRLDADVFWQLCSSSSVVGGSFPCGSLLELVVSRIAAPEAAAGGWYHCNISIPTSGELSGQLVPAKLC